MTPGYAESELCESTELALSPYVNSFKSWAYSEMEELDPNSLHEDDEEGIHNIAKIFVDKLEESENGLHKNVPRARAVQVGTGYSDTHETLSIGIQVHDSEMRPGYGPRRSMDIEPIDSLSKGNYIASIPKLLYISEQDQYGHINDIPIFPIKFSKADIFPNLGVSDKVKDMFIYYVGEEVKYREELKDLTDLTEEIKNSLIWDFFWPDTFETISDRGYHDQLGEEYEVRTLSQTKRDFKQDVARSFDRYQNFFSSEKDVYKKERSSWEIYTIEPTEDENKICLKVVINDRRNRLGRVKKFDGYDGIEGREDTIIIPIILDRNQNLAFPEDAYKEQFSIVKDILERAESDPKLLKGRFVKEAYWNLEDELLGVHYIKDNGLRGRLKDARYANLNEEQLNQIRKEVIERMSKKFTFCIKPGETYQYSVIGIKEREGKNEEGKIYSIKVKMPKELISILEERMDVDKKERIKTVRSFPILISRFFYEDVLSFLIKEHLDNFES